MAWTLPKEILTQNCWVHQGQDGDCENDGHWDIVTMPWDLGMEMHCSSATGGVWGRELVCWKVVL